MSERKNLNLQDLGEGLTEAEITQVLVKAGDVVERLQHVLTIETDKTDAEITSPWPGKVVEVNVAEGDVVETGKTLVVIEVEDG